MSGFFDIFGFANCFDPSDLPEWGEIIWYPYEEMYLSNDFVHRENCLERAEFVLTTASYSYVEEGLAYNAIKVYKLYKKLGFKNFKEYCLKRLKKTAWRVEHIIKAAQTTWNLMVNGFKELPSNVSQAYALYEPAKKKGHDYDIDTAWQDILHISEEENKPITTRSIEATVSPEKKKRGSRVKLPEDVMAALRKKAEEKGQDPDDLAAEIIKEYFYVEQDPVPDTSPGSEPESKENNKVSMSKTPDIEPWEKDMDALVQEKYANEVNYDTTTDSSAIPEVFHSDGDISSGDKSPIRRPPT
ncbi:hypothetical protein [Okeania sp. SIO2B3]|uniref:hypothetical protein n=1 Tax=Okeania sp. SIO2B3 TaxID=2607784 RepID=UPI0013C01D19|nr:hypothetical protein [Okeania sp. SIO2B3]NET47146.1 hypothetical protein [Okeania sp. SIO2B3]